MPRRLVFLLAVPLLAFAALALTGCGSSGFSTQAPLYLVDPQTQVRSIRFSFADEQTFEDALLEEQISLTDMGSAVGFRRRFSWVPLVPPVGVHPFLPVEMQKDVVRLKRFYNRNGFLQPAVDWLVALDTASNEVKVAFTIDEGPPLLLDGLAFTDSSGTAAADLFPPALRDDWTDFRDEIALQRGVRLDDFTLVRIQSRTLGWVRDRGYAFADVAARTAVDSVRNRADVTVLVAPGPRATVDEIQVEGVESVSPNIVRRELPFREGDRFSQSELVDGQREVFGLNLFQIALADVPESQPADSTVTVRFRVREGDPRTITGQAGYFSEAGLTSEATWTHRNFLGGARTFNASVTANTGFGSFVTQPSRLYRASVSLRQPYFLDRRLALIGSPFAEIRDDQFEESTTIGGTGTVLYEREQFKTASLQLGAEVRNVRDFQFGTRSDNATSFVDSLQTTAITRGRIDRFTLGLSGTYGNLDNAVDPRLGYVLRPNLEVAGPPGVGTVEYGRGTLTATGYYPLLDHVDLFARVTGGGLLPYGATVPGEGEALTQLLRLRSSAFFGGGTADVRGWGNLLLGPKALDLVQATDSTFNDDGMLTGVDTTYSADTYFPIGGLTKFNATFEARLPFPGLGPTWGTFVFLDAGRVWTPNSRFDFSDSPVAFILDETYGDPERLFYSAGAGFSFATPVGAVRFSVGYKLNPSFFDLRNPDDIATAIQEAGGVDIPRDELEAAIRDTPVNELWGIPESNRLHLHLTIGQTF